MIDINELRRLTKAATPGPWRVYEVGVGFEIAAGDNVIAQAQSIPNDTTHHTSRKANAAFIAAANPAAISELLDCLEAAESDGLEQARLNGMGGEREAALLAKLEAAEKERDALRAKIEAMEKTWLSPEGYHILMQEREDILFQAEKMKQRAPCKDISMWPTHHTQPTQPAPSVPDKVDVREDKEGEIFSRGSYNEGYDNGWNDCIDAMLATAPKPEGE